MSESPNDKKIALEWIKTIEDPSSNIREQDIYPRLANWIDNVHPLRVLEVGCGQGVCSAHINLNGRDYIGLEPSLSLVERARYLYKENNKRFVIGAAECLPFDDQTFDAIFSVAVLHLLADIKKATSELARVLTSGGSFLIISANPDAYSVWTSPYINTHLNGRIFTGDIPLSDSSMATETLVLHSRDEIFEALYNVGLHVESINTFRQVHQYQRFIEIQGRKVGNQ